MKSYRMIKSSLKTLEILHFMVDSKKPVSVDEIVDFVGIPYGTAMSHLATLEYLHFAARTGEKWGLGVFVDLTRETVKEMLLEEKAEIDRKLAIVGKMGTNKGEAE